MITTVIPTFRRPGMIQQAIRSALAQTWPHLRVAVFDNASGDETATVVSQFRNEDSRLQYHCHNENIGPGANFTYGVRAVQTPFFSLLSDDDVLLPGFYSQAMAAFQEHPEAMFVAMTTLDVDDSGVVLGGSGASGGFERAYYRAGEAFGRVPGIWTGYVFRREVIDLIGYFIDESAGPAADVGFIRHVSARFAGVVCPEVGALLRSHPASHSVSADSSAHHKANRAFWDALSKHIEDDEQVPTTIRSTIRDSIEAMYVTGLRRSVVGSLIDGQTEYAVKTTRVLRTLGYPWSAALLRAFIVVHKTLPLVSVPLRRIGLRRRERQKQHLIDINKRFESRREEFRALLNGTSK